MAAYNIGIGHLEDARIITQMRKKNPDRWADVRANLPRLSDPHWHTARQARLCQRPRDRAVRRTRVAVRGDPRDVGARQVVAARTSYFSVADLDAAERDRIAVVLQQDAALSAPRRNPAST